MKESMYQKSLIKTLEDKFPGIIIHKMDPQYQQGFPDLLLLFNARWALLEVKKASNAQKQPNQEYWVSRLKELSFAAFISPETEDEVLRELQRSFGTGWEARVS